MRDGPGPELNGRSSTADVPIALVTRENLTEPIFPPAPPTSRLKEDELIPPLPDCACARSEEILQ